MPHRRDKKIIQAEFHEIFRPLFQPFRYKIMYGGRGGLKSWSAAQAAIIKGVQQPLRILCAREVQKSIKDSIHQLLSDTIRRLGLEGTHYEILHNEIRGKNGTKIGFVGLRHNPTEIKSWEGADLCIVEEAQAVSHDSWAILIPTIRKPGSEIWVLFNPNLEADPTYQRFVVKPPANSWVKKTSWRHAKEKGWFPDVLEQEMLDLKERDYNEYLHVWEGDCKRIITGCWFGSEVERHKEQRPGVFGTLYQDKGGEPYFEEEPDGIIEIWRHPYHLTHPDANYWQDRYVLGSDIGEGLNQDASVAYVFDRVLQEFVCRMASNKVDAVTWAEMLEELAWYYKGFRKHDPPRHANVEYKIVPHQAFIVPERTGAGITTCKKLHDNNANVFVHMEVAKSGKPVTSKVGWVETRQSKFDLLGDLREYLGTTSSTVYCGTLLAECGVYIHDKETGQLGAAEGYHDDHVIAGALAVKGHYLMESPQEIEPPEAGWRLKMQKEGRSAWAA